MEVRFHDFFSVEIVKKNVLLQIKMKRKIISHKKK